MTGDIVKKDIMAFGHLTDLEMAIKVRMLMRNDLDHEAVCVGARDRIMYLSQENDRLREWVRECRDHVLSKVAHENSEVGRAAEGLGSASVMLLRS